MEKKQSSVEWLVNCITEDQMVKAKSLNEWLEIFEQAKAMHKEEIEDAWLDGVGNWDSEKEADHYYTKTFGGQDNE